MGKSKKNTYASWNNIVMHDLQAFFMPFSLSESDVEDEDNVKKVDFDKLCAFEFTPEKE